jgi:hypothetical protein
MKTMPIIAKESVEIPTDHFSGEIIKSEISRSQNNEGKIVEYVQCTVQTDRKDIKGWNGQFRFSVPANLTKQTALGKLLGRLGISWTVGEVFEENVLTGLVVEFDTKREGYFTNVIVDSIHVVEEE